MEEFLKIKLEEFVKERAEYDSRKSAVNSQINRLDEQLTQNALLIDDYVNEKSKLQALIKQHDKSISYYNDRIVKVQEQLDVEQKAESKERNSRRITAVTGISLVLIISIGLFFSQGLITGLLTRETTTSYVQELNLTISDTQTYTWELDNLGELRSLSVSGKLKGTGAAKVYLEKDGTRYLILDSTALDETQSVGSITGFTIVDTQLPDVAEANITVPNATNRSRQPEAPDEILENITLPPENIPEVIENVTIPAENITNITIPVENVTELIVNITVPENITAENITIPVNISVPVENISRNITIPEENISTPVIENITIPVENITVPEIAIPETEKTINVSLQYNTGTIYDSDDDGLELTTSAIDFTVEETNFSGVINKENLCTQWIIQPDNTNTATAICYGNSECCALIELVPENSNWNDPLTISVGLYGTEANNTVSSRVIFANYSLDPPNIYSEIINSEFSSLPAKFIEPEIVENITENITVIDFNNVCEETCVLTGLNDSNYTLVIEVENATIEIINLTYTISVVEEVDSKPPIVTIFSPEIRVYETATIELNFSVDEATSRIWYELNGGASILVTQNTTLTAQNGSNTISLFATDLAGNTGSDEVLFAVRLLEITNVTVTNVTNLTTNVSLNITPKLLHFYLEFAFSYLFYFHIQRL